jgi:D-alanine-D-alanine ligase
MSLLPKIAARAGLDFPALLERLLALATRDGADAAADPLADVSPDAGGPAEVPPAARRVAGARGEV